MKHFSKTHFSNLLRHDNGNYYVRVRVGKGREVCRSLETDLISIAKLKMAGEIAKIRSNAGRVKGGMVTLGECAAIYLERKKLHGHKKRGPLKPRSLDYRTETVAQWRLVVPGFDDKRPALVTAADLNRWSDHARAKYKSAGRYNGMIESLRGAFDIAVELGACDVNLALKLNKAPVPMGVKSIPTREQFTEILRMLDSHPSRKYARVSVRGMAFTGLRPNEARWLRAEDVDLKAGTLTARETKNGKPRTIELIPQAVEFFKEEGVRVILKAFKRDPRKALKTIAKGLGIPISPYTMRHLHMTRLVESGLDIPSAALIAGHQDRGVTLLRNYIHVGKSHVKKQLEKVVI